MFVLFFTMSYAQRKNIFFYPFFPVQILTSRKELGIILGRCAPVVELVYTAG